MFASQKYLVLYYLKNIKKFYPLGFLIFFWGFAPKLVSADSEKELFTNFHRSTHFNIQADINLPFEKIDHITQQLESNYKLFEDFFSLSQNKNTTKNLLNVRYFYDKNQFDNGLSGKGIYNRKSFIYLGNRKNVQKSILYVYPIEISQDFSSHLGRHSFFSYIFSVLPTLPTWLREGFALCYSNIQYDEKTYATISHSSISFLDDLRTIFKKNPINLSDLMHITDKSKLFEKQNFERNFLYSWGLVNFLVFSGNEKYLQTIKQIISSLSSEKSQEENSLIVSSFLFTKFPNLQTEFEQYLNSSPNNEKIITNIQESYENGDYQTAKTYAQNVLETRPDSFWAPYYLGLIAFAENDIPTARAYYEDALKKNAPEALIDFCMGYLSYYGEKNLNQAIFFFENAQKKDPKQFGLKVNEIIKMITQNNDLQRRLSKR